MSSTWDFVIALVAVINGLGVIRLLSAYGDFLAHRNEGRITHFWIYYLVALFQLMIHFLFWWSIVGVRAAGEVNFLQFLYLLIGPTLLYLGTSILIAESEDDLPATVASRCRVVRFGRAGEAEIRQALVDRDYHPDQASEAARISGGIAESIRYP